MTTESAPGKLTRQELYDRIRETSKDEYILAEMQRLGFWKKDAEKPEQSEQLIKRLGELRRELDELVRKNRHLGDQAAMLRELRRKRMAESRRKQKERKEQREIARQERAKRWFERQNNDIVYVGENVSHGIEDRLADESKLAANGLPHYADFAALSQDMGISIRELRFLSFNREVSKVHHYRRFTLPKKTGGVRLISAPMPRLKRVQYWVLDNVLNKLDVNDVAHGFRANRSIVSNATPHVGKDVVINMDLENFFPSLNFRRVKGLFISLGYSHAIATVLGLLTTEADVEEVEIDGQRWFVQQGERKLPQGAPTSPAITNIVCRRFDELVQACAAKYGLEYTRYADDLTFSGNDIDKKKIQSFLFQVRGIIFSQGFKPHPKKTRVMHSSRRQEVTGVVVNDKLSVTRAKLKKLRAVLRQLELDGPQGKTWEGAKDDAVPEAVLGYARFVAMVDKEKGEPLVQRAKAILQQHRITARAGTGGKAAWRAAAASGDMSAVASQNWEISEKAPEIEVPAALSNEVAAAKQAEERSSPQRAPQGAVPSSHNDPNEKPPLSYLLTPVMIIALMALYFLFRR